MHTVKKVLLILVFANVIRIIPGCCECDESTMPFNFSKMKITNLDNSGDRAITTSSNRMAAEAVAFEVALFDSLGYFFAHKPSLNLGGFNEAKAMKCDCSFPFRANQYLSDISITTLSALSPEINAGSEVSGLFVASPTSNSATGSLYCSLETICNQSKGKTYYDSGVESFGLYLKTRVSNTQARFVIKITFSDGLILSDTTNLINIRTQ